MYKDVLYTLRRHKGASQEEMARHAGVTKSTISKYEKGDIVPSLDVAKKIADFLGTTVDSMVTPGSQGENQITERHARELLGLDRDYIKVIKIAHSNNISPDELLNLINFTSSIKNKE